MNQGQPMRDRRQIEDRRERRMDADGVLEDARETEWYQFSLAIEDLIASGQRKWAEDILRKIQATVDNTKWVTDRQRQAVRRIQMATRPIHDFSKRWPWPVD